MCMNYTTTVIFVYINIFHLTQRVWLGWCLAFLWPQNEVAGGHFWKHALLHTITYISIKHWLYTCTRFTDSAAPEAHRAKNRSNKKNNWPVESSFCHPCSKCVAMVKQCMRSISQLQDFRQYMANAWPNSATVSQLWDKPPSSPKCS